jgi:hypothetical protein
MRRASYSLWALVALGHAQVWSNANPSNISAIHYNGFLNIVQNTLTNTTIAHVLGGTSSGIYSNTLISVQANPAAIVVLGASGTTNTDLCMGGSSTWISDRHPQLWWDRLRNRVWSYGGVCNGVDPQDTWYFQINNPLTNTVWTQKSPVNHTDCNGITAGIAHDSVNDVFVLYCSNSGNSGKTWVYCDTSLNGNALTTAQTNAGCIRTSGADNWADVTSGTVPTGSQLPTLAFDANRGVVLMFGGTTGGGVLQNETWSYNDQTRTWTNRNPSNPPPVNQAQAGGQIPFGYDSNDGKFYYHFSGGAGSNSDWSYNNASNTWTSLGDLGGPHASATWAFDATNNRFVAWNDNVAGGGLPEFWYLSMPSTLSVALTVVEELPIGTTGCASAGACGITRANEPFTQGVPLKDSTFLGAASVNQLGLTGCSAGQFRSLETWPSGNIKWVEVSGIVSSLMAGGSTTCTLTGNAAGNFGGSNLATDNGATITVATGTSTYVVKKANFNLINTATVGATSIITTSSAATRGLILAGPANPNTDCSGGCATLYSSANDPSSTCAIEENGPVTALLKCTGDLIDNASHVYLHHTTRVTFWKNKDSARFVVSLRNADTDSSSFNTATKGFAYFNAALDLASAGGAGTNKYSFGGKASTIGPTTFTASENAQLVQLYSDRNQGSGLNGWNTANIAENSTQSIIPRSSGGGCSDAYCYPNNGRSQEGYTIKDGGTTLETGTRTDYPVGWCDTDNASGVGVLVGGWYFGGFWPKSCELNSGGSNIVYGIWPSEISGYNYWIAWPQYQTHTFFLNFHTSALSSPNNTFLGLQYQLIAQFGLTQLNASGILPQGMILPDTGAEDNFYKSIAIQYGYSQTFACCVTDTSASYYAQVTRYYAWGQGSSANQADFRWGNMILFQTRGFTSRYAYAEMFERYIADNALARSDFAGGWRGTSATLGQLGFPKDTSANLSNTLRGWEDQANYLLHAHIYSLFDWYALTGDEAYKDAITQGMYDMVANTNLPSQVGNGPPRALGAVLMCSQHLHDFALAIGDPTDSATGLKISAESWTKAEQVMNSIRATMNTYNAGTAGNPCAAANCTAAGDTGTDRSRGVTWVTGSWTQWDNPPATGNNNPGGPGTSRNAGQLQVGIMAEGMLEYILARGPSFGTYESDRDLVLGNAFFVRNEWTVTGHSWMFGAGPPPDGTRAGAALDYCNDPNPTCNAGTHNTWAVYPFPNAYYYTMIPFNVWYGDNQWVQSLKDNLNQDWFSTGCANFSECGVYTMASAVYRALNPSVPLMDITPTSFVDNGGGSYTLSWIVPIGATNYLFKWAPSPITYNLGFDNGQTMTFALSPATHTTWWAANNVSNEPTPAAPGTTQSYTFATGTTGLNVNDFSLKTTAASIFGTGTISGGMISGKL